MHWKIFDSENYFQAVFPILYFDIEDFLFFKLSQITSPFLPYLSLANNSVHWLIRKGASKIGKDLLRALCEDRDIGFISED